MVSWDQDKTNPQPDDGRPAALKSAIPDTTIPRALFAQNVDGQAKPNPDTLRSAIGNYGLANEGGGDGVAAALHPKQFGPYLGGGQ